MSERCLLSSPEPGFPATQRWTRQRVPLSEASLRVFVFRIFDAPNHNVFKTHHKTVILSEAPCRSIAYRGFMARSRRTPRRLILPMPLGAFKPPKPALSWTRHGPWGARTRTAGILLRPALHLNSRQPYRHAFPQPVKACPSFRGPPDSTAICLRIIRNYSKRARSPSGKVLDP